MALLLRNGYNTTVTDVTFNITDNQFQDPSGNPTINPLDYEQFFGLGDGIDDLAYTNFELGGPVEVWLPIAGDTEIFRAQINGEIGASFGLNVKAVVNPGTVSATLPYELSVSYPETLVFDNVDNDNNIFGLFFASEFENRGDAGFTTDFPSLTFNLDLVAALDVNLSATLGVLGYNDTFDILDFDVSTSVPLVSLDTARPGAIGDKVEILGEGLGTVIDQAGIFEDVTGTAGESGLKLDFAQFLKAGKGKQDSSVRKDRGNTDTASQDLQALAEELLAGTDVGSLQIFVPNINLTSTFADGLYVTDASRRLNEAGEIVEVEGYDPTDPTAPAGNRSDLAILTADLDGIVSYATGFAFPPLEYEFPELGLDLGPVSFDAAFSYNLFDVELESKLPLEQEFTLTPQLQTRLKFFEANADGSGPALNADGTPQTKEVQIAQIAKQWVFVESGAIRSEAVEQRLREISEQSLTAEQGNTVAEDIALFVDFDAGIPAGFTGQTSSIGGRLVFRNTDAEQWRELVNGHILAQSAPVLGEDQQAELSLDGVQLAYEIDRSDLPGNVFEYIELTPEEAVGALRLEEVEMFDAISETPYLTDLQALNLVYDNQRTYVEVEYKAAPIVTNRLGLEFDLALLMEGIAASAAFSASVGIGPVTVGAGIDLDIGPLFSERFPLFNAELVDLYNQTFAIEEIAQNSTTSFTIGEDSGETDFRDAIVGTPGNDVLQDPTDDTAQVIVGLAGDDLVRGDGDDTLFGGLGSDTIEGGSSPRDYDTAVFTDLPFALNSGIARQLTEGTRIGVGVSDAQSFQGTQQTITHYATGDVDTVTAVEHLRLTDYADYVNLDGLGRDSRTLDQVDTLGGDDVIQLRINDQFNLLSSLRINAGDGDDLVDYASTNLLRDTVIDGGDGIDEIRINADFDLRTGIASDGAQILNFENVTLQSQSSGTLIGDANDNILTGSWGDDTIIGGDGDDILASNEFAIPGSDITLDDRDVLIGGAGADSFYSYAGGSYTTVDYSDSATSIFIDHVGATGIGYRGEAQGDRLFGIEEIVGSDFDDILIGGSRNQTLRGGAGNDRLQAGSRSDQLYGGDGDDLLNQGGVDRLTDNKFYDGGDGFDILSLEVDAPYSSGTTATTLGTTLFEYRTKAGLNASVFNKETGSVRVTFTYDIAESIEVTLDEDGNGRAWYIRDYEEGSARAISYSGTGVYGEFRIFQGVFRETIAYDNPLQNWTFDQFDSETLPGARFSYPSLDDARASGDVNYNAYITNPGNPSQAIQREIYDRETFRNIEGVIASKGNDKLLGNNKDNAFYGSGGNDLIEGAGGDDLLGFGAVQPISDVFSFPGGTGAQNPGGGSGFFETTLAIHLSKLNPEEQLGDGRTVSPPVGQFTINSNGDTVEVGSFLWGQAGNDTLDMRFDRGLDFFPDRSESYARVDLNVAPSNAPINTFTGEQVQYGRAEWWGPGLFGGLFSDRILSTATTFGIENVIGSRNDDRIIGDRNDNIIEGMGGADFMVGGAGFDTLSYKLADEGIFIRLDPLLSGGFKTLTTNGTGDARGDEAINFEALRGTEFDDGVRFGQRITFTEKLVNLGSENFSFSTVNLIETERPIEVDLGAGNDNASIISIGLHSYDMGAGDDIVTLVYGMGVTIDLGAGDDLVFVTGRTAQYRRSDDESYRTNTILGGDGTDTVRFDAPIDSLAFENGQWIAEIAPDLIVRKDDPSSGFPVPATEAETAAVNEAFGGTKRYVLEDVEAIVINGQTMRLDSQDPIMGDDFTLTMDEDARDPIPLNVTVPADESDATYLVVTLPFGADIVDGDGNALVVDQVISSAQLAGLTALPGQDYGQGPGLFIYDRIGADEDEPSRPVNLLSLPQQKGIALNLEVPVDPLGGTLTFTVTEVPPVTVQTEPTDEPAPPGFGDIFVGDRIIKAGDRLTADEVAQLRYIPEQNATGVVGQFTLQADTGTGLRAFRGFDIDPVTLATQDGIATQTVTFDITPQDDAPDVSRLLFPISPDGELRATVSVNDPEGDAFAISVVDTPEFGSLTLQADGSFTYVQDGEITFNEAGFVDDFFTVEAVQDNGLSSGIKTQSIRIIAPEFVNPIVFDETRPDEFFETTTDSEGNEVQTPIALGGLGTDDMIVGHSGADRLFGFGGRDTLKGGDGEDALDGGDGDDTLEGGAGADQFELGQGKDMVTGTVSELDGDMIMDFEEGDSVFIAGFSAGLGQISLSAGARPMAFGALGDEPIDTQPLGPDTDVSFTQDQSPSDRTLFSIDTDGDGTPDAEFQMDGDYAGRMFEMRSVEGGTVIQLAEDGASQLTAANERFITQDDSPNRVFGDAGIDLILTAGGADIISGGAGSDELNSGPGEDILIGGAGFDQMTGGEGADVFVFNASDYVEGAITFDVINDFTPGEDTVVLAGFDGLDANNLSFLTLNEEGDSIALSNRHFITLTGLTETDLLRGDITTSNEEQTFSLLSFGTTHVLTDSIDRFFPRDEGDIIVYAGLGADVVTGDAGDDELYGEGGGDRLFGGAGQDRLIGGEGTDELSGGAGEDVFVFARSDVPEGTLNIDRILDLEIGVDRIELAGFGIDTAPAVLSDANDNVLLQITPSYLIRLENVTQADYLDNANQMFDFI